MADETIYARGLARVETKPTDKDSVIVLILEDTARKVTGYAINPDALNALLPPLLALAGKWADQADLEVEKLAGPQRAISAQRMTLKPGRSAQECAVRIYVGRVELTFLTPLDEVLAATVNLKKQLTVVDDQTGSGFSH